MKFSTFIILISLHFSLGKPEDLDSEVSSTTISSTTVPCPSQENGQFAHPDYCDKFLNCWEGVGVIVQCEHNLQFNLNTSNCDYPSNVDCDDKENSRPQMDQELCPGGYGTFENSDNCGQFIVCHGGNVYTFDCPQGLVYNSTLGVCVYPEQDNSCLDKHPTSTTTEIQIFSTATPTTISPVVTPSSFRPPVQDNDKDNEASKLEDLDLATAFPVIAPKPEISNEGPVLFPVVPSWPSSFSTKSYLKCPEGHRMGFVPGTSTYAVCVKNADIGI